MLVKRLDVVVYEKDGRRWEKHVVRTPPWAQIEDSIWKLDRHRHPWVLIRLTEDESNDEYMTVIGGQGAYWLGITAKGQDQRELLDPAKSSKEGYLEAVLNAARYFSENEDCDPSLPWAPKS